MGKMSQWMQMSWSQCDTSALNMSSLGCGVPIVSTLRFISEQVGGVGLGVGWWRQDFSVLISELGPVLQNTYSSVLPIGLPGPSFESHLFLEHIWPHLDPYPSQPSCQWVCGKQGKRLTNEHFQAWLCTESSQCYISASGMFGSASSDTNEF